MLLSVPPASGISLPFIEGSLTLIAVGVAFAFPRLGAAWFARIEAAFGKLARRKRLAILAVGAFAFLGRLALLPWFPIPLPVLPDDFSFLLSGDTFAHGRLTNPTPPMWVHFESIHISMQPTYMSMYFPGEGMFLALGQVLVGHPWYGMLLANALMCAALCWMLQAWLPPGWAFLGGMIAVLRLALFSYWINTYTGGGAAAAFGGAVVLGAFPRFVRNPRFRYALLMAIGTLALAYTRPYEGLLLCLPVAVMLMRWLFKAANRPRASEIFRQTAVPVLLLVAGATWLGYYDFRVNGSPYILPYTINRASYAITPYYVWQKTRPDPAYRHEEMRRFYHFDELTGYNNVHKNFIKQTLLKAVGTIEFYGGLVLIPPLFMISRIALDRKIRFLFLGTLVLAAGMAIEVYLAPHYIAPFAAAFYAIGLQGMRHLRVLSPKGASSGLALVRFVVTICVVVAGLRVFDRQLGFPIQARPQIGWVSWWFGPDHFGSERTDLQHELEGLPGLQLAVVRYAPDHYPMDEWVYDVADIENSKVIWARDMDPVKNRELFRYYKDRKVWLVQPDLPADKAISQYPLTEEMTGDAQ
jgi:hypothetical protein